MAEKVLQRLRVCDVNWIGHSKVVHGRAVAQWLDASFPPRQLGFAYGHACGVGGGQSGTGAGFLQVLRFPLPIIPPISPLS
jgi:hypothetical protein